MQWHRLPRKPGESLKVFKAHGDVAQRAVVSGHSGDGLELRV